MCTEICGVNLRVWTDFAGLKRIPNASHTRRPNLETSFVLWLTAWWRCLPCAQHSFPPQMRSWAVLVLKSWHLSRQQLHWEASQEVCFWGRQGAQSPSFWRASGDRWGIDSLPSSTSSLSPRRSVWELVRREDTSQLLFEEVTRSCSTDWKKSYYYYQQHIPNAPEIPNWTRRGWSLQNLQATWSQMTPISVQMVPCLVGFCWHNCRDLQWRVFCRCDWREKWWQKMG